MLKAYKEALEVSRAEIRQLLDQRQAIDERIAKLAPAVENLAALCGELDEPSSTSAELSAADVGLSEAIRLAFKAALPNSLTPMEVRDKLREQNFSLDRYKYEMPPIHNTIGRLRARGEIEGDTARENAYKWVSSLKRALLAIGPPYGAANSLANTVLRRDKYAPENSKWNRKGRKGQ